MMTMMMITLVVRLQIINELRGDSSSSVFDRRFGVALLTMADTVDPQVSSILSYPGPFAK